MEHNKAWVYIIGIIAAALTSIIVVDEVSDGKVKREQEKTKQEKEKTAQYRHIWQMDSAKMISRESYYTWKSDSVAYMCDADTTK